MKRWRIGLLILLRFIVCVNILLLDEQREASSPPVKAASDKSVYEELSPCLAANVFEKGLGSGVVKLLDGLSY